MIFVVIISSNAPILRNKRLSIFSFQYKFKILELHSFHEPKLLKIMAFR